MHVVKEPAMAWASSLEMDKPKQSGPRSEHIINSHGLNVMMYHYINNQIAMISMAMATALVVVMLWEILQLLAVAGHGKLSISSA